MSEPVQILIDDHAREIADLNAKHDARVTELLEANNVMEARARDAERAVREKDVLLTDFNGLIRRNVEEILRRNGLKVMT